jgi:hypothetical protein
MYVYIHACVYTFAHCCNPTFGLTTKAGAYKGASQELSPGVTFHVHGSVGECERMNPHIPSELPLWDLEFRWTSKCLEGNFKGQNSLDLKVFYIIGKLLRFRCLKWAHMMPLDT